MKIQMVKHMEQKININLANINNSENSQTIINMVKNNLQQNSDLQASVTGQLARHSAFRDTSDPAAVRASW